MLYPTRQYIEDTPVLDLTALKEKGFITPDRNGESSCSNGWGRLWAFGWHFSHDLKLITVNYTSQNKQFIHTATLNHQPVHFGGSRAFLVCSTCGKNRKRLYILNQALACRECHNIHYKVQSKSPQDRKLDKYLKLANKTEFIEPNFYFKKKYQHYKTFTKISEEMDSIFQECLKPIADGMYY